MFTPPCRALDAVTTVLLHCRCISQLTAMIDVKHVHMYRPAAARFRSAVVWRGLYLQIKPQQLDHKFKPALLVRHGHEAQGEPLREYGRPSCFGFAISCSIHRADKQAHSNTHTCTLSLSLHLSTHTRPYTNIIKLPSICIYTCTYLDISLSTYTHVNKHTHTHTLSHAHTWTLIRAHTQTLALLWSL